MEREGFRHRFVLRSLEEVESAVIERQPLWNNRKTERGPFDIIGDVHGCFDELFELLLKLGYETGKSEGAWYHPLGRKLVFVGDLVDRGPKVPEVVRLVMDSAKLGSALCVPGNHDIKFMRKVWGKDVQITHGLAESLAQFGAYEEYYRGSAVVVYGHTPVPEPEWLNRTINIDTGCVFGGELTALRYPEQELVSVPAGQTYAEPRKPFLAPENQAPSLTPQQQHDDLLDLSDVIGKRIVATRLHGNVTIREENATAALEVMSRFTANPKWLIYLPPTMSPCSTSRQPGLLEHPAEAFDYYRHEGVPRVVCEEKHMGSRAVVVVCRDEDSAQKRFGVMGEGFGVCYTRTGRRFFDDTAVESTFLARVRDAVNRAGFWEEFKTDWLCLDCELMPWSAKAQGLLKDQYAPVGAAAGAMLEDAVGLLRQSGQRGLDVEELLIRTGERKVMASAYVDSYRRYCWPFHSVDDLKLAPFHLLATEGKVHVDKPNTWHMEHSRGYPVESLSPRRSTWSMLPILRARRTRFDGGRNSPPVEARAWLRSRSNSSLVADEG